MHSTLHEASGSTDPLGPSMPVLLPSNHFVGRQYRRTVCDLRQMTSQEKGQAKRSRRLLVRRF